MPKQYRIKPGHTFRDGDAIKAGGDLITLDIDMALLHRDKVEPVEEGADVPADDSAQTSAPDPLEA
jgi:hypothetical protein